jgi:predicted ATPase
MLTRIEIDGFKAFQKFSMDFKPFQVFIGPNGVGKTNLFDAIMLLANLAGENTLEGAFRHSRGDITELFTLFPDGRRADKMTFAAEMFINRTSPDPTGGDRKISLTCTRLRYELTIERRGEGAHITAESLVPIKDADDKWVREYVPSKARKAWVLRGSRQPSYIATVGETEAVMIYRNQDGLAGGREGVKIGDLQRTILSTSNAVRYPTINAGRREMQSWHFLQLNPFLLRNPALPSLGAALQPDGANLAAVVARIERESPEAMKALTKEMAAMIEAIREIRTRASGAETLIEVETHDGSKFSQRVLSDGTLRLLALVTLRHDPKHRGLVCFEEPENGVQPLRLKQITDVLFALATDLEKLPTEEGIEQPPLRQVLVNTHSPGLLAAIPSESLYYVSQRGRDLGRATYTVPVRPELIPAEDESYMTWDQVRQFMDTETLTRRRDELGL